MQSFSGDPTLAVEYGHMAYTTRSGPRTEDIHFVRLPSGSTDRSQKEWVIHGVPGGACDRFTIHPPSDLLAVLQVVDKERSVSACSYGMIITVFNR